MIAKLVTFSPSNDRKLSIDKILKTLEKYKIIGLQTNIEFVKNIFKNKAFISGDYDTNFIDTYLDELIEP